MSRRTLDGAVAVGGGTWWRHGVLSIPATWGRGSSPSPSPRRKRAATVSHPTVEEVSRTRTARLGSKPSSFFPLKMWPNHFISHMLLRDGTEAPVYINWGKKPHTLNTQAGACVSNTVGKGAHGAFSGRPGTKNPLPGSVHTRVCASESLLPCTGNHHRVVNWPCSNTKQKSSKEEKRICLAMQGHEFEPWSGN